MQKFIYRTEQQTQHKIELDPVGFLKKLEIVRNNKLTFGGYLLFVKDYCLISDVQVGRLKGETTIIDSLSLNADIFTELDEIITFIRKNLMVEYIITGEAQRTERFDFPVDAIREIVINMVVHRDYRDSSGSIVKIFDDRIEFYNPGRLYGGITVKDLLSGNYTSQCRNKLLAMAFKEAGFIERYGSGIQRILNICKTYGIVPPVFEELLNGFKVTLYKEKSHDDINVIENVIENVTENVTENRAEAILHMIRQTPEITSEELAKNLKVARRTIARDLNKLKQDGIIRRIGSDKHGHWIVINKG